jgi:cytoskeletal protein RodZ
MKRCPQCDSSFADTDQFCERDGATLIADYSDRDTDSSTAQLTQTESPIALGAGRSQVSRDGPPGEAWKIVAILAIVGLALGITLFVVYQQRTPGEDSNEPTVSGSVARQPVIPLPLPPSSSVSPSPSPEPSPSPIVTPSPVLQTDSARRAMSSSPISTGGDEKTNAAPVTIRLTNGTIVEADEVWETGEGIWYRRRGVVTLLERDHVKAIERPSPPAPSPEVTTTASPARQ